MRLTLWTPVLLGALLCLSTVARAEILGDYLGYTACTECHAEIVEGWQTTPHAHAFETLKQQGEEKQGIPGCVKCHVVAYEEDGGFIDMDLTPELKDVQCENCHGPGRAHVETGGDPDLLKKQPDEASCRQCHTEGQDKNFDYETKRRLVHGATP
ncbi:MAG TPA: cytochrome C554 [Desulfobacteraceae bacterium]|nr:cytochrome c family protein [Deltaproteobacteria bacterium]MBW2355391.1 cytochrome c family protein [Deltaproteobacteria bacterium]HDI59448.1 cytochrome C554 [Desulfobacteraceae bacterium]